MTLKKNAQAVTGLIQSFNSVRHKYHEHLGFDGLWTKQTHSSTPTPTGYFACGGLDKHGIHCKAQELGMTHFPDNEYHVHWCRRCVERKHNDT